MPSDTLKDEEECMSYAFAVEPNKKVSLKKFDPRYDAGLDKQSGKEVFEALQAELDVLQEELYAAGTHSVLLILQGMDTSGKDGTIRRVLAPLNPQGCHVASFKVPTEEELAHDFLWRIHKQTPQKGMFTVFNRSHYEDVLVVRVHNLVPKSVWKPRYEQINNFEQFLVSNNTIVVKCFLHISKEEQEERLLAREQDMTKAWKLSASDWRERQYWDEYQKAYEVALSECSTKHAPWWIIPADRKWYRDIAVSEVLVNAMREHRKAWHNTLKAMSAERVAELQAYRAELLAESEQQAEA
jgi:PPK2 family polyphosphate:nucleotide phosphotransferase